jgi:hypothetical protein
MPNIAKQEKIGELLQRDVPMWVRLKDDPCTYRYGGRWGGKHTALLQGDANQHGQRPTVAVRYVTTDEIEWVLSAPDHAPRPGDSSAGLPGVMDMPEYAVQAGYRYTSRIAGAVRALDRGYPNR